MACPLPNKQENDAQPIFWKDFFANICLHFVISSQISLHFSWWTISSSSFLQQETENCLNKYKWTIKLRCIGDLEKVLFVDEAVC